MTRTRTAGPILVVALAAACGQQAPAEIDSGDLTPATNLADGRISGDFGPRRGFEGEATELRGTQIEGRTTNVTVARSESDLGRGMIILWTDSVYLEELSVGAHAVVRDPLSLDAVPFGVNVCSGSDDRTLDYDRAADLVIVTVEDVQDGRGYQVHTETEVIDGSTGEPSGRIDVADAYFTIRR